jgi:CHAT domain-containing protein
MINPVTLINEAAELAKGGDRRLALLKCQEALAAAQASSDSENEAQALWWLGELRGGEEPQEAEQDLTAACDILRRIGNTAKLTLVLERLGRLRLVQSDFASARTSYTEALATLRNEAADGDPELELNLLRHLAHAEKHLGDIESALASTKLSLTIARAMRDKAIEGTLLAQMAEMCFELRLLPEALTHGEASLQLARELQHPNVELRILVLVATISTELGELEKAQAFYEHALPRLTAQRGGDALRELGAIHVRKSEHERAIERYAAARQAYLALAQPQAADDALIELVILWMAAGQTTQARTELVAAIVEAEQDAIRGRSREERRSALARVAHLSRAVVSVLVSLADIDAAFEAAERGKAVELRWALNGTNDSACNPQLVERRDQMLLEMRYWRHQLGLHRAEAESDSDDAISLELERRAVEAQAEYEALAHASRSCGAPQGGVWKPQRVQRDFLTDSTALLEYVLGDERLGSFLFVVTKSDVKVFTLDAPRRTVESKARQLRAAIVHHMHRMPYAFDLYQHLIQPAESLIAGRDLVFVPDGDLHLLPFAALLTSEPVCGEEIQHFPTGVTLVRASEGGVPLGEELDVTFKDVHFPGKIDDETTRLVDSVQAALAGLPEFDWNELPFLIQRHAISYAPSATSAGTIRRTIDARSPNHYSALMLGFADAITEGLLRLSDGKLVPLERLTHSSRELDGVAQALIRFSPQPEVEATIACRTRESATKALARVLTGRPPNYRFMHFALHGQVVGSDPELSNLVFSLDEHGDPFWSALEISAQTVDAELVVLSACDSGSGSIQDGEGVLSLARAFIMGGALGVAASTWSVADISTSALMPTFYANFIRGQGKADALRNAQLWLKDASVQELQLELALDQIRMETGRIDDELQLHLEYSRDSPKYKPFAHPFYWAGFSFIGG